MTSELQVVGKAASIAIQTWVRNNVKTKARAEEREKNIEWIKRLFTAWRVSHAERKEAGEDDPEEDETPVEIPPSAVKIYPKGTPVPTPTVEVQVLETRVDLRNDMTGRDMLAVGVRNVVLAQGSINSRDQNTQRGERSYAERREKQREQEIGRRQRRLRTRPRRAMSQGKRQQERERREWEEREVA